MLLLKFGNRVYKEFCDLTVVSRVDFKQLSYATSFPQRLCDTLSVVLLMHTSEFTR